MGLFIPLIFDQVIRRKILNMLQYCLKSRDQKSAKINMLIFSTYKNLIFFLNRTGLFLKVGFSFLRPTR